MVTNAVEDKRRQRHEAEKATGSADAVPSDVRRHSAKARATFAPFKATDANGGSKPNK